MDNTNNLGAVWASNGDGNLQHRPSFQADLPPTRDFPLFVEMAKLTNADGGAAETWKETARWVKYEEDIDEGGERWSKPYVPSIHLSALYELRSLIDGAEIQLNFQFTDRESAYIHLVKSWVSDGLISDENRKSVLQALLRPHVHLYEHDEPFLSGFFNKKKPDKSLNVPTAASMARRGSLLSVVYQPDPKDSSQNQGNKMFLRKLPNNSECANILVGNIKGLEKPLTAFVRLNEPVVLGNIAEVPLPTRFLFILLAPSKLNVEEVGKAMGTMFTDPGFRKLAYAASNKEELLNDMDQFLQTTSILPPSVWDSTIRLMPHDPSPSHEEEEGEEDPLDSVLQRTGRPFGGLFNDLKRKIPFYPSDFRDAFSLQVISTWMFLYFACLTPIITFGGLMSEATHDDMGTMESMVSGCVSGIGFALFAGQPLIILGSTGPVLIFEKILVSFAESQDLYYLEFRLWVGLWMAAVLILLVATDASVLVKYITKFTEDNFATLIACIFMFEAVKNVIEIGREEVHMEDINGTVINLLPEVVEKLRTEREHSIFLMSLLLFFVTFLFAYMLKEFRMSPFCPTWFRYFISDFAVIITIGAMTVIDWVADIETPKLSVPEDFAPTSSSREWFIPPFDKNPIWSVFAAALPALLATILIFMDQQITAVIVNRKDHKLQKGCGYHLDLTVLAVLIAIQSLFGIPWFVAATVESLTNVGSLKMESETAAPGERPVFLGVREQRVSNLLVFTTVGLSVLLTPVLKNVPMPVLYGVFLFMGFSALMRMELFHRALLLLMPKKYQPEYGFLRKVPLQRIHLFTCIQILCLAVLWVIKSISATAIGFPLMLVVMMVVRKLLERVFSEHELIALDDLLPGQKEARKKRMQGMNSEDNLTVENI